MRSLNTIEVNNKYGGGCKDIPYALMGTPNRDGAGRLAGHISACAHNILEPTTTPAIGLALIVSGIGAGAPHLRGNTISYVANHCLTGFKYADFFGGAFIMAAATLGTVAKILK